MQKKYKRAIQGKKILVTAGPTWVAIDRVRVMTNIFSGRTGCAIAEEAERRGAKVTLLFGPGRVALSRTFCRKVNVVRYRYFHELLDLMRKEISRRKYDIVIHSAAVSDYIPRTYVHQKIPSGKACVTVRLRPSVKIIKHIKTWDPRVFLVQFKLEVHKSATSLIAIGYQSMQKNNADLHSRHLDHIPIRVVTAQVDNAGDGCHQER